MFGVVESARGTGGVPRWYRRTTRVPLVAGGQRETRAVGSRTHRAPTGVRPGAGYSRDVDLPVTFDGRPGLPDTLGRALRDLRISVTDRCNFRCTYCMPKEVFGKDYAFLPKDQVLTFEEIERLARAFVAPRRREAAHHRRRAARPARPADAHRRARGHPPARRRRGGPHAHDERVRPARARAAAGRRRPEAGDGQPRLARRRDVRGDERHRLPGGARPRRDRRRHRGRA